jgi:hypothetical protein
MRRGFVLGVVAGALVALPASASAVPTLHGFKSVARWSGQMGTGVIVDPSLCQPGLCDTRSLRLALPAGAFSAWPGGLVVGLQWPDDELDLGYDLDLYVYGPDGNLAGSSTMLQYSSDEAAWIQNPVNGEYKIVVTPHGEIGTTDYKLVARLDWGRSTTQKTTLLGLQPWDQQMVVLGKRPATPKVALLPDLIPLKAHNFHMETAAAVNFYTAFDRGLRHPPSCNPQETLGLDDDSPGSDTPHPTRCLRFDSDLVNGGPGPFEIRAYPNNGSGTDAWQVIYNTDGSYAEHKAGKAVFSNAHGHVHFDGFEETGLYEMHADGTPGKLIQTMVDKGRCALDTHNHRFGKRGDQPIRYIFPSTCDQADNQDPDDPIYPNAMYFRSGISAGWDDEYPWFIPDQYIDVSNVPDGRYLIIERINVGHNVDESDPSNNTAVACVDLTQTSAGPCKIPRRR